MFKLWQDIGRDTRLVMLSFALWGIGEGLWMFIQPLYIKSLGATPAEAGFVIGMWGLGRLLFVLPVGILADRWGARVLLVPGWYIGFAGVLLMALAEDWRWAALGFFVYGISAAATPVSNLYVAQSARFDASRSPQITVQSSLTLLWVAYSLGVVMTPFIGGWLGDRVGLRTVYLFSLVWFAFSAVVITRTREYPIPDRPPRGSDYHGVLSQSHVIAALVLIAGGLVAVLVGQTLSSQYLQEARHFSSTTIGAFGSLNALGTALFSFLLGRMAAWRGFYAALWLVLVSFVLFLVSGSVFVVLMAVFLLGAHYAARPLATAMIAQYVPEHQRGLAFALVDTLAGLATIIGTNAAGVLYGRNPDAPFTVGIVGVVAVTVLGWVLLRAVFGRNTLTISAYSSVETG